MTDTNGTDETLSPNDAIVAAANATLPSPSADPNAPDTTAVVDAVIPAAVAAIIAADPTATATDTLQAPDLANVVAASLDVSSLDSVLKSLGHLAQTDTSDAQAIIDLASTVIMQYNAVLKNAGVMLVHTQSVYE